jgi:hypothetical protein
MGGLFPSANSPERLWTRVLAGADAAREVPPGRWLLDPRDAYDPAIARPDRVYSLSGYFLDEISLNPAGLGLPADLLAQLDPVFHLALHAGRQAFESGVTKHLDRSRVGVILGNIALPTERVSALARAYLGRTFAEKVPGTFFSEKAPDTFFLNRYVPGLVAGVVARALGLGGGSYTLDAACASSLYALKLAVDELRAGRADAMLAGGVSRPDCLYTQMGFSQLRGGGGSRLPGGGLGAGGRGPHRVPCHRNAGRRLRGVSKSESVVGIYPLAAGPVRDRLREIDGGPSADGGGRGRRRQGVIRLSGPDFTADRQLRDPGARPRSRWFSLPHP